MRIRSLPNRSSLGAALTAAAFALATLTHPSLAAADETEVSPSGKGIAGGALLGAEVVTIVESAAKVHAPVAYGVGAVLGAVAGGVAGHFVENDSSDGRAPVYMLAVGVGLIIPALVLSLNAMRYQPSDYASEDHAPTGGPPANPGAPGGSAVVPPPAEPTTAPAPAAPPPAAMPSNPPMPAPGTGATPGTTQVPAPPGGSTPPLSLLNVHGGALRLGLPIPEVRPVYSMNELRQYGMAQQTEVRMPLVRFVF